MNTILLLVVWLTACCLLLGARGGLGIVSNLDCMKKQLGFKLSLLPAYSVSAWIWKIATAATGRGAAYAGRTQSCWVVENLGTEVVFLGSARNWGNKFQGFLPVQKSGKELGKALPSSWVFGSVVCRSVVSLAKMWCDALCLCSTYLIRPKTTEKGNPPFFFSCITFRKPGATSAWCFQW